jgi:cysteine desulfurase
LNSYIEDHGVFATIMDIVAIMSNLPRLYLDHAATTPMVPAARAAMSEAMQHWANPSSPHSDGRAARAMLEGARTRIKAVLGWNGELLFTSGASEAIALALHRGKLIATSPVEHDAVLAVTPNAIRLPVDDNGVVTSCAETAQYLAIQSVNNETGVIQPIANLAEQARANGQNLFVDCSQSAGKLPLPDADMIAISGHKLGGPPGIGALLVRNLADLTPTGGQEQGYRRGTENLPAVMALAAALEAGYGWMATANTLRHRLDVEILAAGGQIVAETAPRLATIASYHMPGVSASSQLINFDMAGMSVSAGSACSSGTLKTSHVLAAMGWDAQSASEVIRVSFGPETSNADIDRFIKSWRQIAARNGVKAAAA